MSKRHMVGVVLLSACAALAPLATLLVIRSVLDAITDGTIDTSVLLWGLGGPIAVYLLVNIALDCSETLQGFSLGSLRDEIGLTVQDAVLSAAASHTKIDIFSDPRASELLALAKVAVVQSRYLVQRIVDLGSGVLIAVPALVITASLEWWIPLLIVGTSLPAAAVQLHYERLAWGAQEVDAVAAAKADATALVLTDQSEGIESRSYQVNPFFLRRWRVLTGDTFRKVQRVRGKGAAAVALIAFISGFAVVVPFIIAISQAIDGQITVGTLALMMGLIPELRRSSFIVCGNATAISSTFLAIAAVWQLNDLSRTESTATQPDNTTSTAKEPSLGSVSVQLHAVTYRYPGSARHAVSDVDLTIPTRGVVAIVGSNGSGKSTLGKLLAGLIDPTTGRIDRHGHAGRTDYLAQSPPTFPLTVLESVVLDETQPRRADACAALQTVGLGAHIDRLPDGFDSDLTPGLTDGVGMSGGQWQRLAIARFLYHLPHTDLAIVDEPSASLDPLSEDQLMLAITDATADIALVLVTHRLGLASRADHIVVMDDGCAVAQGDHHSLLRDCNVYRSMYDTQAQPYLLPRA